MIHEDTQKNGNASDFWEKSENWPHKIILMNFFFVSTLEIDSIFVTFDFMAIQRGLDFF